MTLQEKIDKIVKKTNKSVFLTPLGEAQLSSSLQNLVKESLKEVEEETYRTWEKRQAAGTKNDGFDFYYTLKSKIKEYLGSEMI